MEVIIISDPETGKPIAAIKNVGPEEDWELIDGLYDGHLFSDPVEIYERPGDFLEADKRKQKEKR